MRTLGPEILASSFRDPSGFVFQADGVLLRQVNRSYQTEYRMLLDSGLYDELTSAGLLVSHSEVRRELALSDDAVAVVMPERVAFISYPYEWCFGMLRDAALATLQIQRRALAKGMSLKDASSYNIQQHNGRLTLIDTLSFEGFQEGSPWVAYRQFCQHFLAPLSLMAESDVRLGRLASTYVDGIPLDLASQLLPWRTRLRLGLGIHIHVHASAQRRQPTQRSGRSRGSMSRAQMLALIDSLESTVAGLSIKRRAGEWSHYYSDTNYSKAAMLCKHEFVSACIDHVAPRMVWDLGANTGEFSRVATKRGIPTVAFDMEHGCVQQNYDASSGHKDPLMLPLVLDLTNPSSSIGWAHAERMSLEQRGPTDMLLALALVHHLAIGNNVRLGNIAQFFAGLGRWLCIEFVPKSDSQVVRMLSTRKDVFSGYSEGGFESAFSQFFEITRRLPITESDRVMYLMRSRRAG